MEEGHDFVFRLVSVTHGEAEGSNVYVSTQKVYKKVLVAVAPVFCQSKISKPFIIANA